MVPLGKLQKLEKGIFKEFPHWRILNSAFGKPKRDTHRSLRVELPAGP